MPPAPSPVGENSTANVVYALGGARPPAVNWAYYTNRAGEGFFPGAKRELIDYPAGARPRPAGLQLQGGDAIASRPA